MKEPGQTVISLAKHLLTFGDLDMPVVTAVQDKIEPKDVLGGDVEDGLMLLTIKAYPVGWDKRKPKPTCLFVATLPESHKWTASGNSWRRGTTAAEKFSGDGLSAK